MPELEKESLNKKILTTTTRHNRCYMPPHRLYSLHSSWRYQSKKRLCLYNTNGSNSSSPTSKNESLQMKYSQQQLEYVEEALSYLICLFLCCIPPGDARLRKESCNIKYSQHQQFFSWCCRVFNLLRGDCHLLDHRHRALPRHV